MELRAAHPFSLQRGAAVTPDMRRAFVAEGAGIAVLDLTTLTGTPPAPRVLDRIELENASPHSLLYYERPGSNHQSLFVAGGTMGLWRLGDFCDQIFTPPGGILPQPLCPCSNPEGPCDPYFRTRFDPDPLLEDHSTFSTKRCVQMAILEDNESAGGDPLLLVLYAARADTLVQPVSYGPSELRVYRLGSDDSVTLHRPPLFLVDPGLPGDAAATAIVVDPIDSSTAYVSMGTGGLFRVILKTALFTATPYGHPPGCSLATCPHGEQMRDLAIVRTATRGTLLYAVMDYGRVLEYKIAPTVPTIKSLLPTVGGYPDRVSAVTDGGDNVLIAVGFNEAPGVVEDTRHTRANGGWSNYCIGVGVFDLNQPICPVTPPPDDCDAGVSLFKRNFAATPPMGLVPVLFPPKAIKGTGWASLDLFRHPSGDYRSYECTTGWGFQIRSVTNPFGTPAESVMATYRGPAVWATDGEVASWNPNLVYFTNDGIGVHEPTGTLYLKPPPEAVDFVPITDAFLCGTSDHPTNCAGAGAPNPFHSTAFYGVAHWRDGVNEWFLSAGRTWRRANPSNCVILPDDCSLGDPCAPGTPDVWKAAERLTNAPTEVGAQLVRFSPLNIQYSSPGTSLTATQLDMKWFQLYAPTMGGDVSRSESNDLTYSFVDPRMELVGSQFQPKFLYLSRGGSPDGVKIFRRSDLMARAQAASDACSSPPPPSLRGYGQSLGDLPFVEVTTHMEFENTAPGGGCRIEVPCPGDTIPDDPLRARRIFNGRACIFQLGPKTILAVAAGLVATNDLTSCNWSPHFGRPMVVFYDVTDLDQSFSQTSVHLLRVAFEAPYDVTPTKGNVVAVRAKVSGSPPVADVYVGDLLGRLYVYRLGESDLFPPHDPSGPYMGPNGIPNTPVLAPVYTLEFPRDPADAYGIDGSNVLPVNLLDLEIDPHPDAKYLYCALARRGLGVVSIASPTTPILLEIVDTPGFVSGIAFRFDAVGHWHAVVGDGHAGLRLYGRVGQ